MICIKQVEREIILSLVFDVCDEKKYPFYYMKKGDDSIGTIHIAYFADDGSVVGCLSMSVTAKMHYDRIPQYKINGIAVKKEYRGQGIGFALVKMAEFIALNNEAECLWLEKTVDSEKYFLKQGFSIKVDPDINIEVLFKYPEEHCCSSCEDCAQSSVCCKVNK